MSPIGNDFTGLATQNNPIRTIKYALENKIKLGFKDTYQYGGTWKSKKK